MQLLKPYQHVYIWSRMVYYPKVDSQFEQDCVNGLSGICINWEDILCKGKKDGSTGIQSFADISCTCNIHVVNNVGWWFKDASLINIKVEQGCVILCSI